MRQQLLCYPSTGQASNAYERSCLNVAWYQKYQIWFCKGIVPPAAYCSTNDTLGRQTLSFPMPFRNSVLMSSYSPIHFSKIQYLLRALSDKQTQTDLDITNRICSSVWRRLNDEHGTNILAQTRKLKSLVHQRTFICLILLWYHSSKQFVPMHVLLSRKLQSNET